MHTYSNLPKEISMKINVCFLQLAALLDWEIHEKKIKYWPKQQKKSLVRLLPELSHYFLKMFHLVSKTDEKINMSFLSDNVLFNCIYFRSNIKMMPKRNHLTRPDYSANWEVKKKKNLKKDKRKKKEQKSLKVVL